MRLAGVEQALAGKKADGIVAACQSAASDVGDVNADLHASADYRKAMIAVFVRRAVEKALSRS
jgi:carbon-monoxide dehydrogenase medium subunit